MKRWKRHDGKGQPEDVTGPVHVEFRDGDVASYGDPESLGGWIHDGSETDVVSYSIQVARKESRHG